MSGPEFSKASTRHYSPLMHSAGGQPELSALIDELRRSGADPVWLTRLQEELTDHFDDLYAAERRHGAAHTEAVAIASALLGDRRALARACRSTYVAEPDGLAGTSPVAAVVATGSVLRWTAATVLGSAATAATFFVMQLAIFSGLQ